MDSWSSTLSSMTALFSSAFIFMGLFFLVREDELKNIFLASAPCVSVCSVLFAPVLNSLRCFIIFVFLSFLLSDWSFSSVLETLHPSRVAETRMIKRLEMSRVEGSLQPQQWPRCSLSCLLACYWSSFMFPCIYQPLRRCLAVSCWPGS